METSDTQSFISLIKRTLLKYPKTILLVKWGMLSLVITGGLFLTGGLTAMTVFLGIPPLNGLLSIFVAAPFVGGLCAGLWYGVLKPLSQSVINRIHYPIFQKRDAQPYFRLNKDSSELIVSSLSVSVSPSLKKSPQDKSAYGQKLRYRRNIQVRPLDPASIDCRYESLVTPVACV